MNSGMTQNANSLSHLPIPVWGLTGGVGSGKSTAARFFKELGIPVLDADEIAKNLSKPGGIAAPALLSRFGTVDRVLLRQKVFSDVQARKDLEKILHPLIVAESTRALQTLCQTHPESKVILYEAALLVETGRYEEMKGLIVVHASHDIRKKRLMERDGITAELAEKMLSSQTSDQARLKAAQTILHNSGSPEDLKQKVREFATQKGWIE